MLTDLEAVFRSLKSELGMRPVFHQIAERVSGHLFISVLAYHLVHSIRYRLKKSRHSKQLVRPEGAVDRPKSDHDFDAL